MVPNCVTFCVYAYVFTEHAVKVRLELVRGCALVTVRSLQRSTEQTFSSLKKWLEAHYLAEMKKYDECAYVCVCETRFYKRQTLFVIM